MGKEFEVKPVTDPKAFVEDLKARAWALTNPEIKYQYQLALKDVEFRVDEGKAKKSGYSLPAKSIRHAERALRAGVITPRRFVETGDQTIHQVLEFDSTPVGYSGFADCVTHSLVWTDQGIFNLGRYSAMNIADFSKTWTWFIHRCVTTAKQVEELQEAGMSSREILDLVYEELTGRLR